MKIEGRTVRGRPNIKQENAIKRIAQKRKTVVEKRRIKLEEIEGES